MFHLRNPLTFCANADPGAKCEKRGVECEESDAKYPAINFMFRIL